MNLMSLLESRIKALDVLIKIHSSETGDYLVMERAVCTIQLDILKQEARDTNNG
jgi:hypothetical protein